MNEVLLLGFDTIEVSADARAELLPGLQRAVDQGRVRVCGLEGHPFAELSSDHSGLTSSEPAQWEGAIRSILRSITQAAKLDADYLILDLGSPNLELISLELATRAASGQLNDREFVQKKIELIRLRESLSVGILERVTEAFKILLPYAEEKMVAIALTINILYESNLTSRELLALLAVHESPALGYWHDFGDVQSQANLDFLDHEEILKTMRNSFIGAHLNDCLWPDQRGLIPGQGEVALDRLLPLLPETPLLVWSLDSKCKSSEIKSCLEKFKDNSNSLIFS